MQLAGFGHHAYPTDHQPRDITGTWHRVVNDQCDAAFSFVPDDHTLDLRGDITLNVTLGPGPGEGHRLQWLMSRLQAEVTRIVSDLSEYLDD